MGDAFERNQMHGASCARTPREDELVTTPETIARIAPAIGIVALALDGAEAAARSSAERAEITEMVGYYRRRVRAHMLEAPTRRCHCNCDIARELGICSMTGDGSCGSWKHTAQARRPDLAELECVCREIPHYRMLPHYYLETLLGAADREVAGAVYHADRCALDQAFGIEALGAHDDEVSLLGDEVTCSGHATALPKPLPTEKSRAKRTL